MERARLDELAVGTRLLNQRTTWCVREFKRGFEQMESKRLGERSMVIVLGLTTMRWRFYLLVDNDRRRAVHTEEKLRSFGFTVFCRWRLSRRSERRSEKHEECVRVRRDFIAELGGGKFELARASLDLNRSMRLKG